MTKWKGLEVDEIEALIKKESDEGLEKQAEGWAALRDLFDQQLTEMKRHHTNLSEAWDSPGGDLYLGQFQKVIDALEKGKTLADTRATAIMDVAGKIGSTQLTVELLRKELDEMHQQKQSQFESDMDSYKSYMDNGGGFLDSGWGWLSPTAKIAHETMGPEEPQPPDRKAIAAEGSPSINDRVNTAMTTLADEMKRVRNDSEMWEKPEYAGPKDGPAPPPNWGMVMPKPPGINGPGMPGMPTQPGMPNIPTPPTMPNMPTAPTMPNMPTVPTVQTPTIPNVPTIPTMPTAPGTPGVPGMPSVGSPGLPAGMSGRRPNVANPMGNSRPVAPRTGAPGAPSAPTAPGKPGMSGKMAPPMSGMGPKGQKKGVKPGGPGRPGTPMGSSGIPGKPGMSGKMAPPAGGVPPKNSNKTPDRKPGQPMNPAGSSAPGKPGAVKGGKPLAGKPGGASGGPGGSQFKAPPHIGRPSGDKKPKTQSGYGKFGPPEGTPLGAAPRVTKPGGSRPVLNNRSATPTSPLAGRELGVPSNQRPAGRAPRVETDSRGVIKPAKPEPKPTTPQRPADYYEKKAMRLRENPKTAEYMDNLFKMTGLRPPVIEPAAPPKAHTAGPILGT